LSAQTTDKQVNKVVPALFRRFPDALSLAGADIVVVEELIKGVNYYKTKAKNIIKTSSLLLGDFAGNVPRNIDDLVRLPGVGYKTANVFLNEMYQANQGIAVDTHVARVAKRLGWTDQSDPAKIAKDLEDLFDKEIWYKVNSVLVLFGRYVCTSRKPKCEECPLRDVFCSFASS
jgi:endonuclease-3